MLGSCNLACTLCFFLEKKLTGEAVLTSGSVSSSTSEVYSLMDHVCAWGGVVFAHPAPHQDRRSATTFAVPGSITNLYGNAEISQLHQLRRSIVDFDAFTLVVDGSNMYLRLLWSQ